MQSLCHRKAGTTNILGIVEIIDIPPHLSESRYISM